MKAEALRANASQTEASLREDLHLYGLRGLCGEILTKKRPENEDFGGDAMRAPYFLSPFADSADFASPFFSNSARYSP